MPRRLLPHLLLALFLGAGTTLPGADALLHHWLGQPKDVGLHIEPAGGCASHSEQCTLGRTATGAGAAIAQAATLRVEAPAPAPAFQAPSLRIIAAERGAIPQSRAPPAPAA